jgi:hypothetical protein
MIVHTLTENNRQLRSGSRKIKPAFVGLSISGSAFAADKSGVTPFGPHILLLGILIMISGGF